MTTKILILLNTLISTLILGYIFIAIPRESGVIPDDIGYMKDIVTTQNIRESILNSNQSSIVLDSVIVANGYNPEDALLVIKYSALGCKDCIDFIMDKTKEMFPDYINNSQIVVLCSESNTDKPLVFPNAIKLNSISLDLEFENTMIPFMFIYDNKNVNHFIIPDRVFPEQIESYLKSVKSRYFNNSMPLFKEIVEEKLRVE